MQDQELAKTIMDSIPMAMRFIRQKIKSEKELELDFPHFRICAILYNHSPTNRELSEWQGVSFAAMSRMIDGLVKRGLVERTYHEKDRREVKPKLTAKGSQLYLKIRKRLEEYLSEKVSTLSKNHKKTWGEGLSVLQGALHEA